MSIAIIRDAASSPLLDALSESIKPAGGRSQDRLASWIKDADGCDIPELTLNLSLLAEAFLQLLASGLGTLAIVWATVVLLGGFSTILVKIDFWFTTAIILIQTARVIGYKPVPEAKFFIDVPAAFAKRKSLGLGSATEFVSLLTMAPALITLAPIFAAPACMTLSIIRLVGIATRDPYARSVNTDPSQANVKPALILFYALMLAQGLLFLLWFVVAMQRFALVKELSRQFEAYSHGKKWIDRYVFCTLDTCIERGVLGTINRTLVSFAAELVQSENRNDHISALSVLHALIRRKDRADQAIDQICSSEQFVGRLLKLLSSKSPLDRATKAYTAEIVAKLGSKLRLADIPGAASSISSLLDGDFKNIEAEPLPPSDRDQDVPQGGKSLFVHGLLILGEFAGNPENCTAIYKVNELVPKIVAPVSQGLHKFIGNDRKTIQIVKASLGVVAKLTSCVGETSAKIRGEISSNGRVAENLLWILANGEDHEMKMLTLELLTRLNLGEARTGEFIGLLRGLLFNTLDSPPQMPAVRALHALAVNRRSCQLIIGDQQGQYPVIMRLIKILSNNGNSKEYRAVTAELLAQICATSRTDQDRHRLGPLSAALSTVLQAISAETANHAEHQRRFISSLLGLAVQICHQLAITAEAFTNAFSAIQMDGRVFPQILKEIVQTSNDSGDAICLVIVKTAAKLATWMMRTNHDYIQYFQQENLLAKLYRAMQALRDLERDMVLTGRADENQDYESLQSLVKDFRFLVWPQQL